MSTTVLLSERKRSPLARLAAAARQIAEALDDLEAQAPAERTAAQPMTALEFALALGISRAEVYRQVRLGNLKAIHVGRVVRIPIEEFEAFRRRRTR